MKQGNHYVQILQPAAFILDMVMEDLYFPDECHGPAPKACRPGVKYDKRQQPCLHGLIAQDKEQLTQCPVTLFTKRPPPQEIIVATINRYIVETTNVTYHYRCPHTTPRVGKLMEGEYVIDVEPRCVLDTAYWNLHGLPLKHLQYLI